jgi:hypothetical protein
MNKLSELNAKINHNDKYIVISYCMLMHGKGVDVWNRNGKKFIEWFLEQSQWADYKIVLNQASEPISNAGFPSIANNYVNSADWLSIKLTGRDVYLISDSYGEEFDEWIKTRWGWKHLTYRFHFDMDICIYKHYQHPIKKPRTEFEKPIFTCNGNMITAHRILVKQMWDECGLYDDSYWSFADISNFGEKFSDIRFDLFGIWEYSLPLLNNSFLHLVTETCYENFYDGTNIPINFMSKCGRTLAFPTPFIVYGPSGILRHLKELGFQTFDKWWDESYDDILDYTERLNAIMKIVQWARELNNEEKTRIWNEMIPVFLHNRMVLKTLHDECISKINFALPNFFNNFMYSEFEYYTMDEFELQDWCVFYDKKLDGGGTTFGYNAVIRNEILGKIKTNGDTLEMCSGPGFIGYTLKKFGKANRLVLSDINNEVLPFIQKTNEYNSLTDITYINSNVFDSIPTDYQFDTIISNPPHFKTERPGGYRSDNEKLISLDFDMEFHKKFFEQADKYLKPDGKIVLIENCDGVTEEDIRNMTAGKYGIQYVEYNSYNWQGKSTFYTIILYLLGNK